LARAILEVAESFENMQKAAVQNAEKAAESFSVGYFPGIAALSPIPN
jgi:hypothetical protein